MYEIMMHVLHIVEIACCKTYNLQASDFRDFHDLDKMQN